MGDIHSLPNIQTFGDKTAEIAAARILRAVIWDDFRFTNIERRDATLSGFQSGDREI